MTGGVKSLARFLIPWRKTMPDEIASIDTASLSLEPVPVVPEGDAFARFRMHWRGGEHRLAAELIRAGEFAEDEVAALLGEFPDLLEILNS